MMDKSMLGLTETAIDPDNEEELSKMNRKMRRILAATKGKKKITRKGSPMARPGSVKCRDNQII